MKHLLRVCLLFGILAFGWLAAVDPDPRGQAAPSVLGGQTVTLKLQVPESREYPDYNRGYKLTIDGKDFSEPKETKRTIKVPVKKDQKAVTLKYSFWINNYTNIIRTKTVAVEPGKSYDVDMRKEDPKNRDHIEPIYVPTPNAVVEEMLKLAKVGPNDVVWDIGCGDGRMVIMAVEKFGAKKGLGIDIDPERIAECKVNLKKSKVADKVEFKVANALEMKDISEPTVVLLYLGEDLNKRLKPVLQQTLKPGARVVSHRFLMGNDWPPDRTVKFELKKNTDDDDEYLLHLWTIKEKKKK